MGDQDIVYCIYSRHIVYAKGYVKRFCDNVSNKMFSNGYERQTNVTQARPRQGRDSLIISFIYQTLLFSCYFKTFIHH